MIVRGWVGLLVAMLIAGCSALSPQATSSTDTGGYDIDAARAQASTFNTIATGDTWANYGEQFTRFCEVKFGFDCNREGRDLTQGNMSSAQEIQQWHAERNNPQSVLADIGILFIPQAAAVGVLAEYEPPNATLLPLDLHGPGWIATFTGVPVILANIDALESRGLPIPGSWADLANPAYDDLVGLGRIGVSGSGTWSFVAMNLAAGGTLEDWQPGVEYGRRLLPNLTEAASLDTFEKGEIPISVRYDFGLAPWFAELDASGVDYRMIVPSDGSVYAPSTLMLNRYDVAHADFGRMFMEWVLTDEAQVIYARYGSRPIRSVVGDRRVVVPQEARLNWLPDEAYANVATVDWRQIDAQFLTDLWENEVVGGG